MNFNKFFELRGTLDKDIEIISEIIGITLITFIWQLVSNLNLIPKSIFPSPLSIILSLKELHFEDALLRNLLYTIKLNFIGNLEAILISFPIALGIALNPILKAIFNRYILSIRFLALPLLLGIFIGAFGIGSNMKVQFLSLGVIVYLIPQIIQRVNEVPDVYINTAILAGANKMQIITNVFIPAIIPNVYYDIVNLVAISWTYMVIPESINIKAGGIGALSYTAGKYGRTDKVFAIIIIVILIGILQDKILNYFGKLLF